MHPTSLAEFYCGLPPNERKLKTGSSRAEDNPTSTAKIAAAKPTIFTQIRPVLTSAHRITKQRCGTWSLSRHRGHRATRSNQARYGTRPNQPRWRPGINAWFPGIPRLSLQSQCRTNDRRTLLPSLFVDTGDHPACGICISLPN